MITLTEAVTSSGNVQSNWETLEVNCLSVHEWDVTVHGDIDPIVSDGKGGWVLRPAHMVQGVPYGLVVNTVQLIAVKDEDKGIVIYGLPEVDLHAH